MTRARPLRFLALLLCAWIGTRAVVLNLPSGEAAADEIAAASDPAAPTRTRSPGRGPAALGARILEGSAMETSRLIRHISYRTRVYEEARGGADAPAGPRASTALSSNWPVAATGPSASGGGAPVAFVGATPGPGLQPPTFSASRRWSASAWLLLRDERGAAALAPGGTLGGSQAGARMSYRIGRGLALSGRFYLPLRRIGEAEVAAGIDWRPSARLPVHLLAERRQDVGGDGRSAFALTLYGGASGRLPGGLGAEFYGQAGLVGVRSRDLFVDGSVRVALPLGPVEVGGGAWAAAQPGAARLDAGPAVSYRLPVRRLNLRLQADWRFRIGGDAAPGSGPALTLAADF